MNCCAINLQSDCVKNVHGHAHDFLPRKRAHSNRRSIVRTGKFDSFYLEKSVQRGLNKTNLQQRTSSKTYAVVSPSAKTFRSLEALIFDCDGVILESEHLHRIAYNETFSHFNVFCPNSTSAVLWDAEFYDQLQNTIGGGKPKMRWYFNTNGWPSSSIFPTPPVHDSDKAKLIDTLQDWKTEKYKSIISSGTVKPRPGVLQLMDKAKSAGIKVAVCSAATKSSVILSLENLIGLDRFQQLDCFLAGDDVPKKKPDPSIYIEAAKRLGTSPKNCIVIEDSVIGVQAAVGAGMPCVVTYTSSTKDQDFKEAKAVYADLANVELRDLESIIEEKVMS